MKAIIDERPSAVPVGIGNNNSGYNTSILEPSGHMSDLDWSDSLGLDATTDGDGNAEGDGDDDGEGDGEGDDDGLGDSDGEGSDDEIGSTPAAKQGSSTGKNLKTVLSSTSTKRKAAIIDASVTKTPKTTARAGKSTPAMAAATTANPRVSKKPKTGIEKINAIAAKEEETTQKVLDLKKLKVKGENEKELAKIKAKADLKMQQMKLRAELAQKKMDNKF